MATYIEVIVTPNCLNIRFNALAPQIGRIKANFNKAQISFQYEYNKETGAPAECVRVYDHWGVPWCVTYPTNPKLLDPNFEAVPIEIVDGVQVPASNSDLYDMLEAAKG